MISICWTTISWWNMHNASTWWH